MWKTVAQGNTWRAEVKNKSKDGTYYWVDTTINPVRDSSGQIIQFLSVRNIITHKKELEESREALLADFEDFAFLTSHKIRGPLARVLGLIELVRKGYSKEDELDEIMRKLSIASIEMDDVIREMVASLNRNALQELVNRRKKGF